MSNRSFAEVFPPGGFIREEIEARGWSQSDLARIIDRSVKVVNEIINAKRSITPETARAIAGAFGTSAQMWLNLDAAYQLSKTGSVDDVVSRRARLFNKVPVGEMIRRGWVGDTRDIEVLERDVAEFFELESITDDLSIPAAAARTGAAAGEGLNPAQITWLRRARQLGRAVDAVPFQPQQFRAGLDGLRAFLASKEEVRQIPRALAAMGVRLVVVEHLKGTHIDGACIWLNEDTPVVALSMRYDRIDWFWHTLVHELAHVYHGDAASLDENIQDADSDQPESEQRANTFASNFLIESDELDNFVLRTRPLYYRNRVLGFAKRLGIHPALVVGQLQYRGELEYSQFRPLLEGVRKYVCGNALTDGWGSRPRI